jgi:hypothetical protein
VLPPIATEPHDTGVASIVPNSATSPREAMDTSGAMVMFDPNLAGAKRDSTENLRARSEAPSPDAKKMKSVETDSASAAEQRRQS